MRPLVTIRVATADDLPELLQLWQELAELDLRGERLVPLPNHADGLERLRRAQEDSSFRAVVAEIAEEVVGGAVLNLQAHGPFSEARAVHLHHLHVRAGFRRRGVGPALVAAAAAYAEECGAEHVVTSVYPELRDVNRFYARLGFGPMVVRRVAAVSVLRRKLAAGPRSAAVEDLLLRRSALRSRRRASLARLQT